VYPRELLQLTQRLQAFASQNAGLRLMYGLTTAFMCNTTSDGNVIALNNVAQGIMAPLGIPTVNLHDAITGRCGPVPQQSCFGETGCFCPHCPAGYQWLAETAIAPAIRRQLAL